VVINVADVADAADVAAAGDGDVAAVDDDVVDDAGTAAED
jgi:hypothetical protein